MAATNESNSFLQFLHSSNFGKAAVPAASAGTVYVIFLAPAVNSSLGAHKPGTDYLAYHNFVHVWLAELGYLVVPFDVDGDRQREAAARAPVETALNPTGNGWY